ncbi:DNA mismatch repair endonuclease MutL [Deferrisoma camini]|uniref:DNA mismatch repair endonuclease MutL n=1 Tax=Deferrisoma camini TaxID=1035120 RepID=UPI00046D89A2|nr:DNA mismatch repair endonuclease MutL [Deferrisoma camini]
MEQTTAGNRRRVRVLPDEIANRIAAGEVVERPASVVKELVENAVDAGAGRVRVRLEGAGKRLIAVEDDGEGMGREDALLALERHATSKIASADDLDTITTLGFRGEALPSIASVSRMRIVTRPPEASEATVVRVEGGKVMAVESAGAPRGTTVEVTDLFFNVPARLKFLKGDATELRHCVETVTQLALVHYDVGFELRSQGRVSLAAPPGQSLEERAAQVAGAEAPGGLYWARAEADGRELVFAFAAPHEGRGHRRGLRLFVNGRPVQDRLLVRAVTEGYRGLLEKGRYPVALLWVEVPPDEIDVNVHPAKREVRFRDEGRVFRWVAGFVAESLAGAPWLSRGAVTPAPEPSRRPELGRVAEAVAGYAERVSAGGGGRAPSSPPARKSRAGAIGRLRMGGAPPVAPSQPGLRFDEPSRGPYDGLRFLGSVEATYLVFQDPDRRELVILDQHAAHERVLYERFLGQGGGRPVQRLLVPVTVECSSAERAAFEERKGALSALGFRVEPFGDTALAVTETPADLPAAAAEAVVRDILGADPAEVAEGHDALARRAACAAAVKARRALDASEAEALLRALSAARHPSHCPHGRPLVVRLGRKELEGMFHRR